MFESTWNFFLNVDLEYVFLDLTKILSVWSICGIYEHLSLFLIHSFKPASSLGGGSPPPLDVVAPPPPGNNASTSTLVAIPIAVSMEAIVIPCFLNRVRIFSANDALLSKNFSNCFFKASNLIL